MTSSSSGHSHAEHVPAAHYAGTGQGMIADLPNHDFTAGPVMGQQYPSLAPIGGYADMHRGPSPGPIGGYADMHRGPSPAPMDYGSTRGYDAHGYGGTQFGRNGY